MADKKTDEKWWKKSLEQQKEEMEEITENFKEFFQNNQELTADELKNFVKSQAEQAKSGEVKGDLMKRLSAIENIKGADQLTGEELKEELNKIPEKIDDKMDVLSESITKGNELLSSGFSQMTGVLRDSFGPIFDLFDSGWSVLTGIYNTMLGAFTLIKGIPTLLGSMWGYFKRKEKREMREMGGEGFSALIMGYLKPVLTALATALSVVLSPFIFQFKIFKKVFIDPFIWFTKFLKGTRFAGWVSSFIGKMGWFGKTIRGFVKGIGKFAGIARLFGRGLKYIPIVGQVITGIMAIVDFFKAFVSEEGSFVDKIKAGLTAAIAGLVRLPVRLLGWIGDWVLGLFGVKIEGGMGKKVMGIIKSIVGNVVEFLWNLAGNIGSLLTGDIQGATYYAKKLANQLGLLDLWNWIKDLIPSWSEIKSGLKEAANFDLMGWLADKLRDLLGNVKGWLTDKLSFIPGIGGKEEESEQKGTRRSPPPGVSMGSPISGAQEGAVVTKGGLVYTHPAEIIVPQDLSKKLLKVIDNQNTDSISKYENEKIKLYKQIRDYLKSMMESYQEQTRAAQTREESTDKGSYMDMKKDPPDEIESMGLLFSNKSWGLG